MVFKVGRAYRTSFGGNSVSFFNPLPGAGMTAFVTGTEVQTPDTLDGSPLYAKVVDFGSLPNSTSKSVAHSITGLDQVIRAEFVSYSSGATRWREVTYTSAGNVRWEVNTTNITCVTTSNFSGETGRVVLVYTKT